jgi:hypothetical protein
MDRMQRRLRPVLSDAGFRTHGRTLNRTTCDGLVQVINFQMGSFDPPGTTYIPGFRENWYGQFWINLGVYVPEVARVHGAGEAKSVVHEYHCCIRTRLHSPEADNGDRAWPITLDEDLLMQLDARLRTYALPYFHELRTRDMVLARWGSATENQPEIAVPRIVCAIILAERGERERARDLLVAQARWASANIPRHREHVIEVATRLGIDLQVSEK